MIKTLLFRSVCSFLAKVLLLFVYTGVRCCITLFFSWLGVNRQAPLIALRQAQAPRHWGRNYFGTIMGSLLRLCCCEGFLERREAGDVFGVSVLEPSTVFAVLFVPAGIYIRTISHPLSSYIRVASLFLSSLVYTCCFVSPAFFVCFRNASAKVNRTDKELTELGECIYDQGGYFVINGSEKVCI